MTKKMERALTRARRGAAFLDKQLGTGWRRHIRRRQLNLEYGVYFIGSCGCILAQLDMNHPEGSGSGYYIKMARKLDLWSTRREVSLGFVVNSDGDDYDDLTEAWRQVLREPVTA